MSDRDKKKKPVCNWLLFPGNPDLSPLTAGGPVVPLVCGSMGRDNLVMWRELFVAFIN